MVKSASLGKIYIVMGMIYQKIKSNFQNGRII
jgi:hypothetical protein